MQMHKTLYGFMAVALLLAVACAPQQESPQGQVTGDDAQGSITDFAQCEAAGNPIMESHPRQCRTADGKTFTEEIAPAGEGDGTAPSGDVKEFRVEAYQYGFDPDPITVKKGDRVRITFTSRDVAHSVAFPDFGVRSTEFDVGEEAVVEFMADKAGTFTYVCSTYCGSGHREMTGTLVVEE